ncbi:MAG: flagellar biosynthesis anti-sigma factor FlgM [Planctomycetes bacterium]|nr:flagellar biosynthesis anti-sigma factor FlgM [Planctomycetota bacterium]
MDQAAFGHGTVAGVSPPGVARRLAPLGAAKPRRKRESREVRHEKVMQLKAQIAAGSYDVDGKLEAIFGELLKDADLI